MKYSGLTRIVLVVIIAIASYELSRGLINPFSYDLFDSCINATSPEPTFACEWGPQVMVNGLAGIIFFFISLLVLVRGTVLVRLLPLAVMSVAYILLRLAFWRFDQQLNDNFATLFQGAGPTSFSEYVYLLYVSNNTLIMGLILGGFYNIMEATNKVSIDESLRDAPRMTYDIKKSSKNKATSATTRKAATKKSRTTKKK